jgi:hypothetical protein
MMRGLAILALCGVAACSGGNGGGSLDADAREALDWAVLEAAPDSVPVYTEVGLMGCRMSGGAPLCGSCVITAATAEHDHAVGGLLEEHRMDRTDSEGRIRVGVTSELDYRDFPHNGTRAGIDAAIADARDWCEAFHPERYDVLRDVRDTEISTGDEE